MVFLIIRYHIDLNNLSIEGFDTLHPKTTVYGIASPSLDVIPPSQTTPQPQITPLPQATPPPQVTPPPQITASPQIAPSTPPKEIDQPDHEISVKNEPLATKSPVLPAKDPGELTVKSKTLLPDGFIYISEALPEAKFNVRYATTHNFTGQVVDGYLSDKISATIKTIEALKKVSVDLKKKGYGLLIYDAYRPKRAVTFFIDWGNSPEDNLTKAEFYPNVAKKDLFNLSYLARRSAHSRGSTVDLTLFNLDTGNLLDMGSPYDFLDPISNHGSNLITDTQTQNRDLLKKAMKSSGFKELRTEWWHYQLVDEPFPETFFDFAVE